MVINPKVPDHEILQFAAKYIVSNIYNIVSNITVGPTFVIFAPGGPPMIKCGVQKVPEDTITPPVDVKLPPVEKSNSGTFTVFEDTITPPVEIKLPPVEKSNSGTFIALEKDKFTPFHVTVYTPPVVKSMNFKNGEFC